ncbi:MAG: hypothetical protein A3E83_01990 [Gammaproteobacteria bacterium RIFCSPHIGHO2_12_FULL_41_20]|nr:MAG: hypothetical protein A3E83_01990 [Gammaproteobacteria bacterium RIFCSPHIGHO2_12_FULL_41_20]
MNLRAQQVLKILVEHYIQHGSPVSSKLIAEELSLNVSSATVRNILSELEEAGYLTSLHTSSGRVPTGLGYRFFVETLLTIKPLDGEEVQELSRKLAPDLTTSDLLQSASSILSSLTHLIGVVTFPRRNRIELRQIEFLPLSNHRILVILVLSNREVQNRIIYTERDHTLSELQQVTNYLNTHYLGKELLVIRRELFAAMRKDQAIMMQMALEVASRAFESATEETKACLIVGQDHLVSHAKDIDLKQLQTLFSAFTEKQEILNLLDHALEAEGMQIFIGKESGYAALSDWSLVAKAYSIDGEIVGTLGVIGPTRMPYNRVISAVGVTEQFLSAALNQTSP